MAARIEIVNGPARGWNYRLRSGEVRVGRGAGNHIRVDDPAWPDGCLRVQHVQAGYLVTNQMPHPVFLDGEVLPEGEQRTWYHGARLQPTASTVLVLYADEAADSDEPARGVVAVAPEKAAAAPRWPQYLLGGSVLFVVLLALAVGPSEGAGPGEADYRAVKEQLGELKRDGRHERRAERVEALLADARLYEGRKQPRTALARYLEARAELDGLRAAGAAPEDGAAWQTVRDYVGRRVWVLAKRHGLPKS